MPTEQIDKELQAELSKKLGIAPLPKTPLGRKDDTSKPRMGLVLGDFSRALEQVAALGTVGAIKYADSNWLEVKDGQKRYLDALLRHLFAHLRGEHDDKETGLSHLTAVAWNALAVLELQERK